MSRVGIINPGAMGISIAASARAAGHDVYWSLAGRSAATRQRAEEQDLIALTSVNELCGNCDVILCVCPPHAAQSVAEAVIDAGFRGLYCDGNAIAPQKAHAIGARLATADISFVDGSIIGPPAWKAGTTRFYLSGSSAEQIAELFNNTVTEAIVIGDEIGKASALKMAFAALTKGSTALLSAIYGTADKLGVRADLEREWAMRDSDSVLQRRNQVRNVPRRLGASPARRAPLPSSRRACLEKAGFFEAAQMSIAATLRVTAACMRSLPC